MTELSTQQSEIARNSELLIFRKVSAGNAAEMCRVTGISTSTFAKMKDPTAEKPALSLQQISEMLAYYGLKVVDSSYDCYHTDTIELMFRGVQKLIGDAATAKDVFKVQ